MLLLSPFAPHIGEELWQALGHADTLAYEPWPAYDEALTREDTIEIPVQVGKKVRAKISGSGRRDERAVGRGGQGERRRSQRCCDGKEIVKVIVVPGRLVNFEVK